MTSDAYRILEQFDAVVMLTWSNWKTEMRSNRYNYATRFARHRQVVFVQPDLIEESWLFEPTEIPNLEILHVFQAPGPDQSRIVADALLSRRIKRPLLWSYNVYFVNLIQRLPSSLRVYHATEDYFREGAPPLDSQNSLIVAVNASDLLVAVSEGVRQSYIKGANYTGRSMVLTNGCDYGFWSDPSPDTRLNHPIPETGRPAALYQGGIHGKIDLPMIHEVAQLRKDWDFWFCGSMQANLKQWNDLVALPNVRYFGLLPVEQVRAVAQRATVGIIPFVQDEWIKEASFPLKAFEYVSVGLPVVTTPIDALEPYSSAFWFASNAQEFSEQLVKAAPTRHDPNAIEERHRLAKTKDYDARFDELIETISRSAIDRHTAPTTLSMLVLYDDRSTNVSTIREHLESLSRYSRHEVHYAIGTNDNALVTRLEMFDVIVVHYSVRLSLTWHLSDPYADALTHYDGYKVLFVQDEYETTENLRNWMDQLQFNLVFTCVPDEYREQVYPSTRFPKTDFVQNLTGYVPDRFESLRPALPVSERATLIGYRGRALPYWYGDLGYDKYRIGVEMRQICEDRNLNVDIEWTEDKRIYGPRWYDWLQTCRSTLGTESGSNVFDDRGEIAAAVKKALAAKPDMTYPEARETLIAPHEGPVRMNQVSPRVFEAIACRTALVLFEGSYSNVLEPNTHYIPLKPDYSNVDDVLSKVQDGEFLEQLVERAYRDIIATGKWNYRSFAEMVDRELDARVTPKPTRPHLVSMVIGSQGPVSDRVDPGIHATRFQLREACLSAVLDNADLAITADLDSLMDASRVSVADPGKIPAPTLKDLVAHKLSSRPRLLKSAVVSYQALAKTGRGLTAAGRRAASLLRRPRT